jgi:sugar-phosphatase
MQFHCAAILFDLDGVLVDSIAVVDRQWRLWAKKHGLDPEYMIHIAHGHRTVETVAIALPDGDHAAEAAAVEQAEIDDIAGLRAGAGAAELVSKLPPNRWGVVTSGTRALATTRLRAVGLPVPLRMVPADEVKKGKPDPESYLKGASLLGVLPQDCLVFEDAPTGVRAASAAGMRVIGIPGTYAVEHLSHADGTITSLREVDVTPNEDGLVVRIGAQ